MGNGMFFGDGHRKKWNMKKLQLISGMIVMAFAALFCFEGSKLPLGTPRQPGPAFLPLGYGILLFIISTIFVIKSGFRKGVAGDAAGAPWHGLKWKRVPYVAVGLLGYAFCLESLGYLVSTAILVVTLLWVGGVKRSSIVICGGLAITIATYILFKSLLKVRLPSGFLGI